MTAIHKLSSLLVSFERKYVFLADIEISYIYTLISLRVIVKYLVQIKFNNYIVWIRIDYSSHSNPFVYSLIKQRVNWSVFYNFEIQSHLYFIVIAYILNNYSSLPLSLILSLSLFIVLSPFISGTFSFGSYAKFKSQTITEFIEKAVEHSRSGRCVSPKDKQTIYYINFYTICIDIVFYRYLFFLHRRPEHGPMRVQLTNPVSRFKHVQSLQHMCRCVAQILTTIKQMLFDSSLSLTDLLYSRRLYERI